MRFKKWAFQLTTTFLLAICFTSHITTRAWASDGHIPVEGISISPQTLSLKIGETAVISVCVYPSNATNKGVSWQSDDTSVATVSGNKIKAIGHGIATITAVTHDGGFTAGCRISVEPVCVTGITLNKTYAEANAGESFCLTAMVLPANATNKNVVWESSDSTVASVDSGRVVGKTPGQAVITATAVDGGFCASCAVEVKSVPVDSVVISRRSATLAVGEILQLEASVLPANATDKSVSWTSSSLGTASVLDGRVSGISPGYAVITAQAGTKTAECEITVIPAMASPALSPSPDDAFEVTPSPPHSAIPSIPPDTGTVSWFYKTAPSHTPFLNKKESGGEGNASTGEGCCFFAVYTPAMSLIAGQTAAVFAFPKTPGLVWSSSDEGVASVTDGVVTAHKPGVAVISVSFGDTGRRCVVTVT